MEKISVQSYSKIALPHLEQAIQRNEAVMNRIAKQLAEDVQAGKSLLVFGSGHSGIFPMELLLPTAGPSVVRVLERTAGAANAILNRVEPSVGEMIWISSQSGINPAVVDFALEAKKRGLRTVAFTSVTHSSAVPSRHSSGKRLFEVCDEVVDFGGFTGDAAVKLSADLSAGPLSTLTSVLLGHSIIVAVSAELEARGIHCVYTSVNTPTGESRNKALEDVAKKRDFLLR
jgi:uncharacterized phosphosugar-binding protein